MSVRGAGALRAGGPRPGHSASERPAGATAPRANPGAVSGPRRIELSYGDLFLYMFANLGGPANWPQIAAGLEQAASGNGSAIETA